MKPDLHSSIRQSIGIYFIGISLCLLFSGTLLLGQPPTLSGTNDLDNISQLLSEYIQHESISGNEYAAGEFLSNYCQEQGLYVEHLTRDTSSYNFCASLYPLSDNKPNILLLNHIDVVPEGNAEDWTYPPYSGAIAEGAVWGRGSIDNKGMAVMEVFALQQFVDEARTRDLPFNVTLMSVSAEEVGGELGAKVVTDSFIDYLNPILVLGEGGSGIKGIVSADPELVLYGVSVASKRGLWLRLKCKIITSGHGSIPAHADANKVMIRALERLNSTERPIQFTPATLSMFHKLGRLEGGLKGMALRNIGLFKPFVGSSLRAEQIIYALVSNTATLTNMSNPPGALNKISEEVEATLDCRLLPETDSDDFIEYLRNILGEEHIEIETIIETPRALGSRPGIFYKVIERALLDVYPDGEVAPILFPAFNDNNYFRAQGIPAFGILPIEMSQELLESIHSIDEKMPQDMLLSGSRVYHSFIDQLFKTSIGPDALTQNIRGTIIDKTSQIPLSECIIVVASDTSVLGAATTNVLGRFEIDNIPIGRHKVKVFDPDYRELEVRNVVIGTGRETVLHLSLEEGSTEELVYTGQSEDLSINDLAFASTRTFAVEETERYAGSRGDPARMVANFAGVRGLDDTRNDIIVRGNSPTSLLWRLEGIDIPNPNHFALFGSTGGGVNVISNKILENSDFISGAMPAEYGNAIAGVFDLRLRNGNSNKFEFMAETGVLATEILAEGPLNKESGASYLVAGRHSTFDIINHIDEELGQESAKLLGIAGIPEYQDLAFKLNFPLKDNASVSVFGLAGRSAIELLEENRDPCYFSFEDHGQDVDFETSMGVAGINYERFVLSNTHARISLYSSIKDMYSHRDLILRDSATNNIVETRPKYRNEFYKQDIGVRAVFNTKMDARHSLRYGFNLKNGNFNLVDSLNGISTTNYEGNLFESNFFAHWKYKMSNSLTLSAGIHSAHFNYNGSTSFEPRLSAMWHFSRNESIAFAAGLYSAQQPSYIYFQLAADDNGEIVRHNKDLDFTKSQQYVLSYFNRLSDNLRLKIEGYYQRLSDVPVEVKPSSFSLINDGINFKYSFPGQLTNSGTGENFGVEATLERYYNKGYYYLMTGSLYSSTYEGSDLERRSTDFDGGFAVNGLFGKEFTLGKKKNIILGTGIKITYAGGRHYTPIDLEASIASQDRELVDSLAFTKQFPIYFRTDLKLTLKINQPKFSHEIGLDLLNIVPIQHPGFKDDRPESCKDGFEISTLNPLSVTFDPVTQSVRNEYQLGFLPLLYYRVDF